MESLTNCSEVEKVVDSFRLYTKKNAVYNARRQPILHSSYSMPEIQHGNADLQPKAFSFAYLNRRLQQHIAVRRGHLVAHT